MYGITLKKNANGVLTSSFTNQRNIFLKSSWFCSVISEEVPSIGLQSLNASYVIFVPRLSSHIDFPQKERTKMAKFGLFAGNVELPMRKYEGDKIVNAGAEFVHIVAAEGSGREIKAIIRLAEGQSVREIK
jgi:hypothetical protein